MTGNTPGGTRILGSLRRADGKGVVRREGCSATDIDDLWSALTEPRRLARRYGEIAGDLRVGGEFHAQLLASGWEGTGRVNACEPSRRLLVTMTPSGPNVPGTVVEATLAADGDQTILVVEERGMPLDLLAAYGAGAQIHVEDLADYLAGRERHDAAARWNEFERPYRDLAVDVS